jgi:putative addiction module killer protein
MHTKDDSKFEVFKTDEFEEWLDGLQPKQRTIVVARLDMISIGHFGDHKRFEGLLEFRWKNGTRAYGFFWGSSIVVALYGGSKHGQDRDIKKAKRIRDKVLEGTRTIHQP